LSARGRLFDPQMVVSSMGNTFHDGQPSKWTPSLRVKSSSGGMRISTRCAIRLSRYSKVDVTEEWRGALAGHRYGGMNAQVYTKKQDVSFTCPFIIKGLEPLAAILIQCR
jgi:hypothetical protein